MDNALNDLLRLLARTPSADNSQPWRFTTGELNIGCHSVPARSSYGSFGPIGHATLLSAGAMYESMHQLFGCDSNLEFLIGHDHWSIDLTYRALPDIHCAAARRLANRHTNRFPYSTQAVKWPIASDQWPSGGRAVLISERTEIAAIGAAVKTCSAARFTCQELHEWLFSSLRWNDDEVASGDGLDIATLDLPPGGRQFMRFLAPWPRMEWLNKFGLHRVMAIADSRMIVVAPAIVAIVGYTDPGSVWEAGRIMQATWGALNEAGLSVHPYYVVTDIANRYAAGRLDGQWHASVEEHLAALQSTIGIENNQQIHILFRVGVATRAGKKSVRLPIARLIDRCKQ